MQSDNTSADGVSASRVLHPDWEKFRREAVELLLEAKSIAAVVSRGLHDAGELENVGTGYAFDCAVALDGCSRLMLLSLEQFDRIDIAAPVSLSRRVVK